MELFFCLAANQVSCICRAIDVGLFISKIDVNTSFIMTIQKNNHFWYCRALGLNRKAVSIIIEHSSILPRGYVICQRFLIIITPPQQLCCILATKSQGWRLSPSPAGLLQTASEQMINQVKMGNEGRRRMEYATKIKRAAAAGATTTTSHPCIHVPQLL